MLECKNLSKQYKRSVKALDNFSGHFTCGIYGILGPNGAGKSTLLNMMAQLISPTSGKILFDDRDISLLGSEYRKQIGYLPQPPRLCMDERETVFGVYVSDQANKWQGAFRRRSARVGGTNGSSERQNKKLLGWHASKTGHCAGSAWKTQNPFAG